MAKKTLMLVCLLAAIASICGQRPMVHPGQCPRQETRGPCVSLCVDDASCDPNSKCCNTGCGRVCKKIIANQGPLAAVQRPLPTNQRQGQLGASPISGPNSRLNGPNRNLPVQQQQQQQQQLQLQLSGQPSLVNIGGCSRGVSLRNSDGTTLVCGFGPHDFACPPDFACTFDNGLRALVCCPSENATRSASSSLDDERRTNPCPDGEPIKDEFGARLKCDFGSGPANACPTGTLCVVGACCPVSVAGLISVKPGKCPLPLPVSPGQNCQNDCTFDADCPGPAKCCFVGCGARCVASIAQNSPNSAVNAQQLGITGLATNPNVAGPLSGQAASLSQFNLQRSSQQQQKGLGQQQQQKGLSQQQQQNPFFNQQRQQFQFPNNGPPGTSNGGARGPPGQQQRPLGNGNGNGRQTGPPQFQPLNRNRQFDQAFD